LIKCVVWDIDHTLLTGVYLESVDHPPLPDRDLVAVARELSGRGILHALASRNPPEAARYVHQATGVDFAAEQLGWDSKAEAIERIASELAIGTAEIAFVDDDMLDRAEVSAALPDVLVLTPEDAAQAASWPEFRPAVITAEARRRAEMYQARRRRQAEAASFGGSREEFLRHVGTRVTIARAGLADVPRLHELSVRTHQLNSAGTVLTEAQLATLIAAGDQVIMTVALADHFGDDGIVGGAVIDGNVTGRWRVPALMMSCRALGRGVLDALLAWICRAGAAAGATELWVPCLVTERNVPMRLALTAAGLRAGQGSESGHAMFTRSLDGGLPDPPDWVSGPATRP
jgi:methoxymalonate biosynthesis protein